MRHGEFHWLPSCQCCELNWFVPWRMLYTRTCLCLPVVWRSSQACSSSWSAVVREWGIEYRPRSLGLEEVTMNASKHSYFLGHLAFFHGSYLTSTVTPFLISLPNLFHASVVRADAYCSKYYTLLHLLFIHLSPWVELFLQSENNAWTISISHYLVPRRGSLSKSYIRA